MPPHQRLLRGAAGTLRWTHLDGDGEPAAASGSVTAKIVRADGTTIDNARATSPGDNVGEYTATVTATETANLDTLTVTWSDNDSAHDTTVEIAGGFLFSLTRARESHEALAELDEVDLLTRRLEVEWECEQICGRAFVPRHRTVTLDGTGTRRLVLPDPDVRAVVACTVGGTSLSSGQLDELRVDPAGWVDWDDHGWEFGVGNVTITYTYGLDTPPPDLVDAALLRLRELVTRGGSSIPLRATRVTNEAQVTLEFGRASARRTGIDVVDAVYARYSAVTDTDTDGPKAASRMLTYTVQAAGLFPRGRG